MSECARRTAALAGTWEAWGARGELLTDEQWAAPTRCPGWDVAAVSAHASIFPQALAGPLPPLPVDPEVLDAPEVLRRFNRPGGVAHTAAESMAAAAVADAATHGRREILERFTVTGTGALGRLAGVDPRTLVPWPASGGALPLAEALRIVLMESVVHYLDVSHALGTDGLLPPDALRETVVLLAQIPPAVEFVEAATGRGAPAAVLPVLR